MNWRNILVMAMLLVSVQVKSWAVEDESVQKYNAVIENIYNEILELKDHYPELSNFSKDVIRTDSSGFKEIVYRHKAPTSYAWDSEEDPYAFRFTLKADKLDPEAQDLTPELPEWRFSLLGFKVTLETHRSGQFVTFDPEDIVGKNIEELNLLEQNVLPFRLEMSTDKEVYTTDEFIIITVTLRNLGDQPFKVVELNEDSLYCKIDDMVWGSETPQDTTEKVLSPHGTITKILRARGIAKPKTAQISCRYGVGFRGVLPYNRVKVLIKSPS